MANRPSSREPWSRMARHSPPQVPRPEKAYLEKVRARTNFQPKPPPSGSAGDGLATSTGGDRTWWQRLTESTASLWGPTTFSPTIWKKKAPAASRDFPGASTSQARAASTGGKYARALSSQGKVETPLDGLRTIPPGPSPLVMNVVMALIVLGTAVSLSGVSAPLAVRSAHSVAASYSSPCPCRWYSWAIR